MYSISDLKPGVVVEINEAPYLILEAKHLKMGRGGAILQTKLKNLINDSILDKNFKGAEKIKSAGINQKIFQFLYQQSASPSQGGKDEYFFMDSTTFEQISMNEKQLGNQKNFLKEGLSYDIFFFQDKPVNIELPIKIDFKIIKTEPAVKGDTVSKATKKATIETGFILNVPLFIKEGDLIKIDTRSGEYLERTSLDKSK